ncbi:hypothetical protein DFH27DRAFT_614824 [Peziza echinospora]|nr:hypothetical protein DFH27DRAFT_614824 [Peziza echinospora]
MVFRHNVNLEDNNALRTSFKPASHRQQPCDAIARPKQHITLRGRTDVMEFRLFPVLVAVVGFAETWDDLVQDAALHLLAAGGVTHVVLVVKLCTAQCTGKRPWLAGVDVSRACAAEAELHKTVFEIRSVLWGSVADLLLVGLLTAVNIYDSLS